MSLFCLLPNGAAFTWRGALWRKDDARWARMIWPAATRGLIPALAIVHRP